MAKYRRGKKLQPSVQTFYLTSTPVGGGTTVSDYVDLSQIASLMNRRFYRQGINWAVSKIKLLSVSSFSGSVTVSKLPNTWVMSNAWEKSFRTWQKMNNDSLEETQSVRPKFLDFKIYADSDHHAAGFGANLLPLSLSGTYAPGEWESSKIYIPDTTSPGTVDTREMIAVGGNFPGAGASGFNAVSLIEGYAASRGLPYPTDPNVPADADSASGIAPQNWMAALFNEGTTQDTAVLDDMINENNQAPYPFEGDGVNVDTQYPGGANQGSGLQIHDTEFITGTTIGGTTYVKGGNFPCGLMRFDFQNDDGNPTSNLVIQIDLVPGSHRGYLCEPMTEM